MKEVVFCPQNSEICSFLQTPQKYIEELPLFAIFSSIFLVKPEQVLLTSFSGLRKGLREGYFA